MKAITIPTPGDADALVLDEVPTPEITADEVLVHVAAAGVNRADLMQRQGFYPPPPGASAYPGLEVSGTISALGSGVTGWAVGDQVCALLSGGGYAEQVAVPATQLLPVPDGVSLVDAAALPEVVCTVWSNVFMTANLQPGHTFGTEVPDNYLYGDLEFLLRSCLFAQPILRGIAPTLGQIGEPRRATIAHALTIYKEFIRPILPQARVFHHTPILPFDRPQPWCVLEYASPDGSRAVAGIFRLTGPSDGCYRLKPRGLRAGTRYRVQWDNSGESVDLPGYELQRDGIEIRLESVLTSELVLLEAI